MRDAKEANTANMPTNRSSPTGVVVVRDQHAPADESLLLLLRLERRARRVGIAGRRLLGRIMQESPGTKEDPIYLSMFDWC